MLNGQARSTAMPTLRKRHFFSIERILARDRDFRNRRSDRKRRSRRGNSSRSGSWTYVYRPGKWAVDCGPAWRDWANADVERGRSAVHGWRGGPGLDARVSGLRIMDPTLPNGPSPDYPGGYASYFNAAGQTVNPLTGQTVAPSNPWWHIVLPW
jgi:hypothetical protein